MELHGLKWLRRVRRRERTTRWPTMQRREPLCCSGDLARVIQATCGNGMARYGLNGLCLAHRHAPSLPWPMTRLVGKSCYSGAVRCGRRRPIARPGSGTAPLGPRCRYPDRFRDANMVWPSTHRLVVLCFSAVAMEWRRSVIHGNGMALRGRCNHHPAPRRERIMRWRSIRFGGRCFCLLGRPIVRAGRGRGMAFHGLKLKQATHQIEHSIRWSMMPREIESFFLAAPPVSIGIKMTLGSWTRQRGPSDVRLGRWPARSTPWPLILFVIAPSCLGAVVPLESSATLGIGMVFSGLSTW